MPFSVVADAWAELSAKVPSWGSFVRGDTEEAHPLTDGAAEYATATIENALLVRFTEGSVEAFTHEQADGEMRLHWRSLCLYERSINGGERSENIVEDYQRAVDWLKLIREGKTAVKGLVTHAASAEGARGRGLVRFRSRRRVIDDENDDYTLRNPRI